MPAVEELKNYKIIGVFDFDDGFDNFKGLNNGRWDDRLGSKTNCLSRKRKQHNCFYALLIPVPESRNGYADADFIHNYLS